MADTARARPLLEEALDRLRAAGDERVKMQVVGVLGMVALQERKLAQARTGVAESAAWARDVGFTWWEGVMLANLVEIEYELGQLREAETHARELLELARRLGDRQLTVYGLAYLAAAAAEDADDDRAGRLWGAVEAEGRRGRIGAWDVERDQHAARFRDRGLAFEQARTAGHELSLDRAVDYALSA